MRRGARQSRRAPSEQTRPPKPIARDDIGRAQGHPPQLPHTGPARARPARVRRLPRPPRPDGCAICSQCKPGRARRTRRGLIQIGVVRMRSIGWPSASNAKQSRRDVGTGASWCKSSRFKRKRKKGRIIRIRFSLQMAQDPGRSRQGRSRGIDIRGPTVGHMLRAGGVPGMAIAKKSSASADGAHDRGQNGPGCLSQPFQTYHWSRTIDERFRKKFE